MSTKVLLEYAMMAEGALCAAFLFVCWRKGLLRQFGFVAALAVIWGIEVCISIATLYFRKKIGLTISFAYDLYFYSYWLTTAVNHILTLCVLYQVFKQAMIPFRGLRRLGTMIFRWICGVSIAVTLGITLVPSHKDSFRYITMSGQLGQSISILTICLLLFVCFSAHHLGMSYKSRLFGLSLGMGIQGMTTLILSAWTAAHGKQSLYSSIYLLPALSGIVILSIWNGYFLLPEPVRKMVLLPTTSPYFHWNQVSEALGDSPGMVAVAGFTPDMLAPAERTMLGNTARRLRESASSVSSSMAVSVEVPVAEPAIAMTR